MKKTLFIVILLLGYVSAEKIEKGYQYNQYPERGYGEYHATDINYKDGKDFKPIEITLKKLGNFYVAYYASYNVYLSEYADGYFYFRDKYGDKDHTVIFQPKANHVPCYPTKDLFSLYCKEAFGDFQDLQVEVYSTGLRFKIVITDYPFSIGSKPIDKDYYISVTSKNFDFKVGPNTWNKQSKTKLTGQTLAIGNNAQQKYTYVQPPVLYDSDYLVLDFDSHIMLDNNEFLIEKTVPADIWSINLSYPLVIDPDLKVYAHSKDGRITNWSGLGASWNAVRTSSVGQPHGAAVRAFAGSQWEQSFPTGGFQIHRYFNNYNTSSIPDDATIDSVSLALRVDQIMSRNNETNADNWIGIERSDISNPTVMNKNYYNDVDLNNIDIASKTLLRGFSTTAYTLISLNRTDWVNVTGFTQLVARGDNDLRNVILSVKPPPPVSLSARNYVRVRTTDYTGTGSDPYLNVSYTIPSVGWIMMVE